MCSNWDSVPIGALEQVAECLEDDYFSLSSMRLVCKSWCDAVSSARICLCPRGFDDSNRAFMRPRVLDFSRRQFSPVMRSEYLERFDKDSMRVLEICVLDNMQKVASLSALAPATENRLIELSLQNSAVTDAMLLDVLPRLRRLQVLNLQGCAFLRGECLRGLEHTQELHELKLGACGMDIVGSLEAWTFVMPRLRKLKMLNIMNNIVSDECIKLLVECSKLEYLDLRKCPDVTLYDGVYCLSRSFPHLETLKIGPLFHCTTDEIWQMLPRFRGLKALEIMGAVERHARPLTDVLETSIWHLPRLEKVSLMDSQFDWSTIKVLSISCGGTLEYLNLGKSRKKMGGLFPSDQSSCSTIDSAVAFPKLKVFKCNNGDASLQFLNRLLMAAPSLVELDLCGLCLAPSRAMRRALISHYQAGCRQLEEIYIFSKSLGSLRNLEVLKLADTGIEDIHCAHVKDLHNLKVVDISKNPHVTDAPFKSTAGRWKAIKALNISETGVRLQSFFDDSPLEHLEELQCSGNIQGLRCLCEAITSCPMKTLHLTDCGNLDDESLGILLTNCREIRDLSLAGCHGLSSHGLLQVTMLPKLTKLNISRLSNALCDDSLQHILAHNTSISELHLSGHENLSRDSLEFLLSSKLLQFVDISFCFGMGDDDQWKFKTWAGA